MASPAATTRKLPLTPGSLQVGCVGGGQLGRMMALEASRMNIGMRFLDPNGQSCPAAYASATHSDDAGGTSNNVLEGLLDDEQQLQKLSEGCDVVTMEIEHVGVEALRNLEEQGVNVQPSSRVVRIIQDKFVQKEHFQTRDIPLAPFLPCPTVDSIKIAASRLGTPLMLKSRKGAYDGRGNAVLRDASDASIQTALTSLFGGSSLEADSLYAEQWVPYTTEIAVMVVRSVTGETRSYPAVTAIQKNSICRVVLAPARDVSDTLRRQCEDVAKKAVASLGDGATGVFGVELFLTANNDTILLNEVAPRPHNTGHYTQDACTVSQFENHLRAVCGLELGDCVMTVGAAAMVNILGAPSGSIEDTMDTLNGALSIPRCSLHWYGKATCRPGRKMGHVNLTGDSHAELEDSLQKLLQLERIPDGLVHDNMDQSNPMSQSPAAPPLVAVIMGSTSDLPTMQAAVSILRDTFGVACEVDVVSAHRTPDKLMQYARGASSRGIQCIVAGAGGAAHLPGMVAAMTPLPVIGVPIKTSTLNGQDSLLSIVQMPRGIPVATVAIGNATNAGLLAVRILASSRPQLQEKMVEYQKKMKDMVDETSESLRALGSEKYLEGMANKSTSVNV